MRIEIGGGTLCPKDWTNMDPRHGEGEWKRFAQNGPWPVADGSVEAIRASHVMEHIPAGAPRIEVMNEAHRVLSPGGTFEIIVPNCLSGTWHAWADPTHISFWCPESFHYFDGLFAANADYNIRLWQTLSLSITDFQEVAWTATPRNK